MNNKIILLVEDNPSDIELTKRALRKNNIANRLVIVDDGEKALNFLFRTGQYSDRNPDDYPTVILLDINLPKINGIEVLKKIRENESTRLIPVVMLTTSTHEQDLIMSYKSGANSYIRKPVDFIQFAEAIRNLGLYWLVLNEPPPME